MYDLVKNNIFLTVPYSICVGLAFYVGLFSLSDIRLISFLTLQDITNAALLAAIFIVPQLLGLLLAGAGREFSKKMEILFARKYSTKHFFPNWIKKIISILVLIGIILYIFEWLRYTQYVVFMLFSPLVAFIDLLVGDTHFVRKNRYAYFAVIGIIVSILLGMALFLHTLLYADMHQVCDEQCKDVRILVSTSNYIIVLKEEDVELYKHAGIKSVNLGKTALNHLEFMLK